MSEILKTNISVAYWCQRHGDSIAFEPAKIPDYINEKTGDYFKINDKSENYVSWFDNLFDGGGIKISESGERPTTLLITGPPGSGKTTFALELCLRIAISHGFWSLYISTESETNSLIKKVESLKIKNSKNRIFPFNKNIKKGVLSCQSLEALIVYGQENIKKWETFSEILKLALEDVSKWLLKSGAKLSGKLIDGIFPSPLTPKLSPTILVFDSLNMVAPEKRNEFFEKIIKKNYGLTKLIIVILDSYRDSKAHEPWEFICDNIIRLDYSIINLDSTSLRDYYMRNIEVVKARNQAHIWGKQQMKIYTSYELPQVEKEEDIERISRAHPYREEGGIFIYPSIHFLLSTYKKRAMTQTIETVPTPCDGLNEVIKGFPIGRCAALMGCRGGHKSHLGYIHLLERIQITRDSKEPPEAGLIISLRDDEQMTKKHMIKILKEKIISEEVENIKTINRDDLENIIRKKDIEKRADTLLKQMLRNNELEILYFPPGYITPDEFFHRMFMSVHKLKSEKKVVTLLFNSLDQISARFPLCAHQPIFIPAMIESLSGEKVTSIFIAVDEPGQPVTQYGLLPMADLILTFSRLGIKEEDYYNLHGHGSEYDKSKISKIINSILLEVTRFSGGEKAGARGLFELVYSNKMESPLFYEKPGLYFKKWDLGD